MRKFITFRRVEQTVVLSWLVSQALNGSSTARKGLHKGCDCSSHRWTLGYRMDLALVFRNAWISWERPPEGSQVMYSKDLWFVGRDNLVEVDGVFEVSLGEITILTRIVIPAIKTGTLVRVGRVRSMCKLVRELGSLIIVLKAHVTIRCSVFYCDKFRPTSS